MKSPRGAPAPYRPGDGGPCSSGPAGKSQPTWMARPDATPPRGSCPSLPPSRPLAVFRCPRRWARRAPGLVVGCRMRRGEEKRDEAAAPRAQTHRSGSADPPLVPLSRPFHCTRPRKLLTSGLTAPALTPHSLLDDLDRSPAWRVEKLASERGLGTAPALEPSVPIHRVTYATFP